jgi:DNA-binding IclR family transcriptional regulator
VVELLELLAGRGGHGLSLAEVSRQLGVHKATCHSMLTELLKAGWLLRDPVGKSYQLGPALARLGAAAASRFPALDLARPVMAELSAATGAHCIAFSISPDHVTVVDQVRNRRASGHPMPLGTELPTRPPYGASLAAWLPIHERDRWLEDVPAAVREHYRAALRLARRRGYSYGLHVLADVRLQELASLIRATETRQGRLGELASALTEEIMLNDQWFPASLTPRRLYEVSHLDSAVVGQDGRPVLMLSLVPVPSRVTGAQAAEMGRELARRTAQIGQAMAGGRAG